MPTVIYNLNANDLKAGQPVLGWDVQAGKFIATTPAQHIERTDLGILARTEQGGEYLVVSRVQKHL